MSHPILPFMPAVFIPVRHLKTSIEWYASLLDRSIQPKQDGGGIYYFALDDTDIILDSNIWGYPPTIMFDALDIDAAYRYCQERQYAGIGQLYRYTKVAHFNVLGNMLCQTTRKPPSAQPEQAHSLLRRISRVLVHGDERNDLAAWYETFLHRSASSDSQFDDTIHFRMDRGAHLLVDDNRLARTDKVHYGKLQLDLRANPVFIIETPDIEAALLHVQGKGAHVSPGIERRQGTSCFTFYDPDGNGMMVCQSDN